MSDHGPEVDPPAPGGTASPGDVPELALVPDDGPPTSRGWIVSAAVVGIVAVLAVAVGMADLRSERSEGADGADLDRTVPTIADLDPAGPRDGLDSLRLPVTVEPAIGLVDDQVVTVSGSQFPPHTALGVVMCSGAVESGAGSAQCQLSPYTPAHSDAHGNFTVEHHVRRLVVVGGQVIDCAAPPPADLPSTCVVAVGAISDYDQSGIAPVSFDDSVPAPEPPALSVAPSEGLVDGDLVTVTLTGFDEEWGWWPQVCTTYTEPGAPGGEYGATTTAGGDDRGERWCEPVGGTYQGPADGDSHQVVVSRWFGTAIGIDPVDCGSEPGRCWIEVHAGPLPIDPVPLSFDPSVPAGPPPPPPTHPEWDHPTTTTP